MCKWGTEVVLNVFVPVHLSSTGKDKYRDYGIDQCIGPIVQALNDAGAVTIASCCGHGKRPGNIVLADGRELIIARNYDEARAVDAAFAPINSDCGYVCGFEEPYGFVPEDGCPIHDPALQLAANEKISL
jgi:hypothetical protein